MSKHFYVYYSYEEFGRGYIGSRGCKCLPEEDFKYYGSFRDKNFNPTQKIILGVYESRKDAYEAEILLHEFYDVSRNPHFANRSKLTTTGFSTEGVPINKGKKRSKEFCEYMRKINLGRPKTPQEIEKHRKNMMGNQRAKGYKPTEEEKEIKRQKNLKKVYSIVDPSGKKIIFNNLRQFSKENNLDRYYLKRYVATGEWKQYKGWTNFKVIEELSPSPADC